MLVGQVRSEFQKHLLLMIIMLQLFFVCFLQERNHSAANLRDAIDDLPILVTGKNTVMYTRVTSPTIAKLEDVISLTLIPRVFENI